MADSGFAGINSEAIKRPSKNILPPFDSGEWDKSSSVKTSSAHGYEISFSGEQYCGFHYYLDDYYRGKTLSMSIEELEGSATFIIRYYVDEQRFQRVIYERSSNRVAEDIFIPHNADRLNVKIESSSNGEYCYFNNPQLEESPVVTSFEKRYDVVKEVEKGIRFNGTDGYLKTDRVLDEITSNGQFTFEAIIRNRGERGTIIQNTHGGSDRNGLTVRRDHATIGYYDTTWYGVGVNIPFNEYVHIIATNDKGTLRIFANGKEGSISSTPYVSTSSSGMYIGRVDIDDRAFFDGDIKLIRVYNRAFGDDEVVSNFEGDSSPYGVIYELDTTHQDIKSNIVKDSSNNNNDATMYGGVKYIQKESYKKPTGKNLVPPLSEWTYTGGARYENGIAVLDGYGSQIESPLIDVENLLDGIRLSAEYYSDTPSLTSHRNNDTGTKFARLANSKYYDINGNPIDNNSGHSGNGNAKIVGEAGVWTDRDNWFMTMGTQIKYMKVSFTGSTTYSPPITRVRNPMLTRRDDDWEIYEEYKLSPTLSKRKAKKSSFKKYPFEFSRKGIGELSGKVYGLNQPRISQDGGIMIEEDTKNLVESPNVFSSGWNHYRNGYTGSFITEFGTEGLDIVNEQSWCGASKTVILPSAGTYTLSVWVKPISRTEESIDISLYTSGGGVGDTRVYADWSDERIGEWQKLSMTQTYTSTTISLLLICFGGINDSNHRISAQYTMPQVEEKPYGTSFTKDLRSDEHLVMPDIGRFIDLERGSIELELVALTGQDVDMNLGFYDLSFWDEGGNGFIIRRNESGTRNVGLVVGKNGSVVGRKWIQLNWSDGDYIKYRIDWDKSKNETKLTINDELITTSQVFSLNDNISYNIGSRGSSDKNYDRGNALYKYLVIRNRWGETVFKL